MDIVIVCMLTRNHQGTFLLYYGTVICRWGTVIICRVMFSYGCFYSFLLCSLDDLNGHKTGVTTILI